MHYLLEWHLEQKGNTEALLLTLDGDVEFSPSAVVHLLNSLQDDKTASAVCGRTHPLGSGIACNLKRAKDRIMENVISVRNIFSKIIQ